mmetsp:Transcript_9719/g.15530  ORF Transcript_9719/g.15530 Transcript_9719/m.15530 type:complete len:362 (+) Transcript_9719:72-1157(+)
MEEDADNIKQGTDYVLGLAPDALLEILQAVLPQRIDVFQELMEWAVPDHMFGTARALLSARYHGVVKSFSEEKGYGFITSAEITEAFGQDLFIHRDQLKGFAPGTKVNFAILLNKGKAHAFDVAADDKYSSPASPVTQQSPSQNGKGSQWQGAQWQAPYFAGGYDGVAWGKDGAGWGKDGKGGAWGYGDDWGGFGNAAKGWAKDWGKGDAKGWGKDNGQFSDKGTPYAWSKGGTVRLNDLGKASCAKGQPPSDTRTGGYAFAGEVPSSAVQIDGVTDRRWNGLVKSAREGKFGFLVSEELTAASAGKIDASQDIYVHWNHVKDFNIGDAVSFAVILNEKGGLKAVDVQAIGDSTKRARIDV